MFAELPYAFAEPFNGWQMEQAVGAIVSGQ